LLGLDRQIQTREGLILLGPDRQIRTSTGIWQPILKLVVSLPNHLSKEFTWSILLID
jgi:hypothetical protein